MDQSRFRPLDSSIPVRPADAFRRIEMRLDSLCDLIDEELHSGGVEDLALSEFTRRITGEVDHVMSFEDDWLGNDFI